MRNPPVRLEWWGSEAVTSGTLAGRRLVEADTNSLVPKGQLLEDVILAAVIFPLLNCALPVVPEPNCACLVGRHFRVTVNFREPSWESATEGPYCRR